MPIIKNSLFSVMQRFPDRKESVKRLFKENDEFQILCEDYSSCAAALQHWNRSSSPEAPQRRDEYTGLLEELEKEILECIRAV
jgi:hypothetical protein